MSTGHTRHLISLRDLTRKNLDEIVDRGLKVAAGDFDTTRLKNHVVGVYFTLTSTRTRTAFTTGAQRLGAQVIGYGPDDLQLNTGETLEDTIRVLSRMLDVLVVRTSLDSLALRAVAEAQEGMAVINAMSDDEHPTQALADLLTLRRYFGRIEGLKILYMGEGNNTASALGLAISRYPGAELHLRTPKGYGVPTQILAESNRQDRMGTVVEKHDLTDLPDEVHVVYTTRWQTTGTRKPDPHWKSTFSPFRVDERLMARYPDAIFMHDLPAHRGEEVDAAVIDGTRSIVFDQAAGKLYSAMAALEWCLSENECGSL